MGSRTTARTVMICVLSGIGALALRSPRRAEGGGEAVRGQTVGLSRFAPRFLLAQDGSLRAGGRDGVYERAGSRWVAIAREGTTLVGFERLAFSPADRRRVYAAAGEAFLRSPDGGRTWTAGRVPPHVVPVGALCASSEHPDQAWLSRSNVLWRTRDGGRTWTRLSNPNTWSIGRILSLPGDRIFLATTGNGILFSPDGGDTWEERSAGLPKGVGAEPLLAVEDIVADPRNPRRLWAGVRFRGVYATDDGGGFWKRRAKGLPVPYPWSTGPARLAVSLADPDVVYLALSWPVHSRRVENALFRSSDGGHSWKRVGAANPEGGLIQALAADPVNPMMVHLATSRGITSHEIRPEED